MLSSAFVCSRRSFLVTGTALTLGAAAGCRDASPEQMLPAAGGAPTHTPSAPGGTAGPGIPLEGPYAYHSPFTLGASSSLSEDFFAITVPQFDVGRDQIVSYTSAQDFTAEAILVIQGELFQLHHDPTSHSGWSLSAVVVDGAEVSNVADMVAGVTQDASGKPAQLFVAYRDQASKSFARLLRQNPDRSWTEDGSVTLSTPDFTALGPLRLTYDGTDGLLIFADYQADAYNHHMSWVLIGGPQNPVRWSALLKEIPGPVGVSAACVLQRNGSRYLVVAGPDVSPYTKTQAAPFGGMAWTGILINEKSVSDQALAWAGLGYRNHLAGFPDKGGFASVQCVFAMDETDPPFAIVRASDGSAWCNSFDGKFSWQRVWTAPASGSAEPFYVAPRELDTDENPGTPGALANKVLDLYVMTKSTGPAGGPALGVLRQVATGDSRKDSVSPTWSPMVPVAAGVRHASFSATRASGDALVFISVDPKQPVQQMTRDNVSRLWTQSAIHLPAATDTTIPQTSYRVRITLTDGWGTAVVGAAVSLAVTSGPGMTALLVGQSVRLSTTPTVVSTNARGQVVLSVQAGGLDTAQIVAQVKDPDGKAVTLTVSPNQEVNDFLAGQAPLAAHQEFSSQALSAATVPGTQTKLVTAGAGDIDKAVAAIQGAGTAARSTQSARSVRAARGIRMGAIPRHAKKPPVGGIFDDITDTAADFLSGVRAGVVSVVGVKTGSDAGGFFVSFFTELENWAEETFKIVVNDLQTAAHAFHAAISWLGTEVGTFIDWIKAKVLGVLEDTLAVAQLYAGWVESGLTYLNTEVKALQSKADQMLEGAASEVTKAMDTIINDFKGRSMADLGAPPALGGRRPRRRFLLDAPPEAASHASSAHGEWLSHNISAQTVSKPAAGDQAVVDGQAMLLADVERVLGDFGKAFDELWAAVTVLVSNPKEFLTAGVADLLGAVKDFAVGGVDTAKVVVDFICNLIETLIESAVAALRAPIPDIPLVGPLLRSLQPGSNPPPITMGALAMMIAAFPTVVAKQALEGEGSRPFESFLPARLQAAGSQVPQERGRLRSGQDDPAKDLTLGLVVGLEAWTIIDVFATTKAAVEAIKVPEPPEPGPPSPGGFGDFFALVAQLVDLGFPVLLSSFSYPTDDERPEPWTSPMKSWRTNLYGNSAWAAGMGPTIGAIIAWSNEGSVAPAGWKPTGVVSKDVQKAWDSEQATIVTMINTLSGLLAMGFSWVQMYGDEGPVSGLAVAAATLPNIGLLCSFATAPALVESTEGVSALVEAVLIGICGTAGAVSIGLA